MRTRFLAPAVPITLAILSLPEASVEEFRFGPEAGSEVRRRVSTASAARLEDVETEVNGEVQEAPEDIEVRFEYAEDLVVLDRFGATEDGRVQGLTRTFESLSASRLSSTPEGDEEEEMASELDGSTVVFSWDGDDEEYTVAFAEDESGDEELLEELDFDMDCSFLLPEEEVEVGDSWELDVELSERITNLAGELHLEVVDLDEEYEDPMEELMEEASDNVEGEFTATLQAMTEEEGRSFAVIELVADTVGEAEGSEDISEEGPDGSTLEGETATRVEVSTVFEGILLWDLEAGRMHALDIEAEITLLNVNDQSLDFGEFQLEVHQELTFEGTSTLNIVTETP